MAESAGRNQRFCAGDRCRQAVWRDDRHFACPSIDPQKGNFCAAGQFRLRKIDPVAKLPPYRRPVNMMFQSYALFPHMTAEANIAFGLKQEKRSKAEIRERV